MDLWVVFSVAYPNLIPLEEISILGIDIEAISTDSLGITAVLSLVLLGCGIRTADLLYGSHLILCRKEMPFQTETDLGPKLHGGVASSARRFKSCTCCTLVLPRLVYAQIRVVVVEANDDCSIDSRASFSSLRLI